MFDLFLAMKRGAMMNRFSKQMMIFILIVCVTVGSSGLILTQTVPSAPASANATPPPGGDPWPRIIPYQGATILIFQPQIESWKGNMLQAFAAVSIKNTTADRTDYGVIWFTARTEVDKVNRVVALDNFQLTKQNFPSLPNNGSGYTSTFQTDLPWNKTIPLDHLEAALAVTDIASQQTKFTLQNNPPRVIFSITPAVLGLIDGQPVLQPSADNLQKVVNTRALILFDPSKNQFYLALMDGWVQASSIQGPWTEAKHEPTKSLDKIKQGAVANNQNQILGNAQQSLKDAIKEGDAPTVYVSTVPADLLLTQGEPQMTTILGTNLQYASNSGNDIFMDIANQQYYILLAGRWFSSSSLQNGPWQYVAASSLPSDFSKIPASNPKASVLVSVPGTPQAKEALIANQIPQTAAISRTNAKLDLKYDGPPKFQPIQGTSLQYAVNTPTPVIDVPGNTYYACQNAVWFTSAVATGPWVVATAVPPVIYTIPPSSPVHYVTYVQVYGSTPSVVYVGYTPGYYGTVVSSDNVVVYGTGWIYPSYITTTTWVPAPTTYGTGAAFSWSTVAGWGLAFGIGLAVGSECSPWWGPVGYYGWGYAAPAWGWYGYGGAAAANVYGHWGNTAYAGTRAAWANPYTGNIGTAARGSYYNPVTGASGVGERGANYNAYTGNYEAGGRAAGYNPSTGTAYAGSRGTVGNAYTGNYASGARGATYNSSTGVVHGGAVGTYGNAYTGQSVSGARGFTYNTQTGNGVAHANNSVYADHDGNVYKYNQNSGWQQHTSNGWENSTSSLASQRSSLNNWQSARGQGSQRWGNFSSGGWGGGFGGGGWADRGSGGWGSRGGGGFRGGGFRR